MADLKKMQGYSALGVNLSRQKYGPLDVSNVFYSLNDFKWYLSFNSAAATTGAFTKSDAIPDSFKAYPYEGQIVAVEESGVIKVYVVGVEKETPVEGLYFDYAEVGSKTLGDGNTIDLVDGELSIHGFGDATNKQVPYKDAATGKILWGDISGLIPGAVVPVTDNETINVTQDAEDTSKYIISIRGKEGAADSAVLRKHISTPEEGDPVVTFTWDTMYSKGEVDTLLAGISQFKYEVVDAIPAATAENMGKIFLYKPEGKTVYEEYIVLDLGEGADPRYKTEKFGDTDIKLTDYYTKTEVDTELGKKVDKVEGSSLVADTEITKLAGLTGEEEKNVIVGVKLNGTELTPDENRIVDLGSIASDERVTALEKTVDGYTPEGGERVPGLTDKVTSLENDKLATADLGTAIGNLTDGTIAASKVSSGLDDSKTLADRLGDVDTSISGLDKAINGEGEGESHVAGIAERLTAVEGKFGDDGKASAAVQADYASNIGNATTSVSAADVKAAVDAVGKAAAGEEPATGLIKDVEDLKAAGATKVEASETNGNIKINGVETTVYTEVANTVHDEDYKHITVTGTSVSDGTTTFTQYDDAALSGRVSTVEDAINGTGEGEEHVKGLSEKVADLEAAGATKVEASETNGNIKINGTETTVYTLPTDVVQDAQYATRSAEWDKAEANVLEGIQVAGNDIDIADKKANIGLGAGVTYDTTSKVIKLDLSEIILDGGDANNGVVTD